MMYSTLGSQLEKLTLFKPVVEKVTVFPAERPVTPIYEEVIEPASSLIDLHNLLKRRILVPRIWALSFLSIDEQEELAAILFSEVTKIWPDLQSCGHIALLTEAQNRDMLRRMTIYVVTTCEILFDRHIDIFQKLLKTGVFEKLANFTRVKRLLAEEAAKLLDVLTVRRYIGDDIRSSESGQPQSTRIQGESDISFAQLVSLSRPSIEVKQKWSLEADLHVLKAKLPNLDLSTLRSVLRTLPALPPIQMGNILIEEKTTISLNEPESHMLRLTERVATEELLLASSRLPDHMQNQVITKRTYSATDTIKYYEPEFVNEKRNEAFITQPVELNENTKKAIAKSKKLQIINDPELDIPPLLKATLYLDGVSKRTAEKEQRLAELQKMIAELENKRYMDVRRSVYIQPDYFEVPISKTVVMRASGPRVTERQLEAAISLQCFTPLFDELSFDITEKDIAEMDETLFANKELADVYKEIVAVIPKDYLDVSSDKAVLPTATGMFDLARCIASTRLRSSFGSSQVNKLPPSPNLKTAVDDAPWSKDGFKAWVKSGPSKALCTTNRVKLTAPLPPGSAAVARSLSDKLPDYMDPKIFLSWHSWWRQFFSTEDFYKYVNRQDTDFLHYVYHLWGDEGGRFDSAVGLSSGPGSSVAVSPRLGASPGHNHKKDKELTGVSGGNHSTTHTPGPQIGSDYWVVDSSVKENLETEKDITTKIQTSAQLAKEVARIFTVTGLTHNISLADLAAQRIEQRRRDEQAKRKLTPDEVLEKELSAMTIQQRFQRVWDLLRLDDEFRARMIFKYSSADTARLLHVVKLWESATHAILKREYILGQFEQFERIASDPNRFYDKGYLGSSQARFDEEVVRESLRKQLDEHEVNVKAEITRLANGTGGDVALYRGRPYVDKMMGDRVQVLFWLSEERKANAIRRHLTDRKLNDALFNNSSLGPTSPPMTAESTINHINATSFSLNKKPTVPTGSTPALTGAPLLTVDDILNQPLNRNSKLH